MESKRAIRTIRLENILSFGPDSEPFPLEPLNVLIGPNASGKSNLIEALSLLEAAPRDLQRTIREGGGIREWLWKGADSAPTATVEVTTMALSPKSMPLRYRLSFTETGQRFELRDEAVENETPTNPSDEKPDFYYRYQEGHPVLNVRGGSSAPRQLMREDVRPDQSILSQLRDPDSYPELWSLTMMFSAMWFYRGFDMRRGAQVRLAQKPDGFQAFLLEDASNLSLVLSELLNQPRLKGEILDRLRDFYPWVQDVVASVSGGTVQLFFHEKDLRYPVPATRLSDGTLRYLCLLAVLCHPDTLPVVCIDEPELGLHPDVIPEVAKLLVEASSRKQLIVTTHSDILVDALTDTPESVVVCEKVEGATQLRRLDQEQLKPWLEQYRLGDLWTRGEIGGNRW